MKAILCAIVLMASFSVASAIAQPVLDVYYFRQNVRKDYTTDRILSVGDILQWDCHPLVTGATEYSFMRDGQVFDTLAAAGEYFIMISGYLVKEEDIGAKFTCKATTPEGDSPVSLPISLNVKFCTDDDTVSDFFGQKCGSYMDSPLRCGTLDNSEFKAADACCICGGGTQILDAAQQPTVAVVDELQGQFSLTVGNIFQDMQVVCQVTRNDGTCCDDTGERWMVTESDSETTTKHTLNNQISGLQSTVTCTMPNGISANVDVTSRYRCQDTDTDGSRDPSGLSCADYNLGSRYAGGGSNTCADDATDANYAFSQKCCICDGGVMLDPFCVVDELNPVSNSGDTQCDCSGTTCASDKYCYDGVCSSNSKTYNYRPTLTVPTGAVVDGSTQTLTCTANSDPAPTSYKWYLDGAEVPESLTGITVNTLDAFADMNNHGKPYTCTTVNTLGESDQSEGRSLAVDGQPDFNNAPTLTTTADVTQLKVGDVVDMMCKGDASPAVNAYVLVMDGSEVATGSTETLQLTITKAFNGKSITCTTASSTLTTPVASTNTLTLNVHYNDSPTLTSDPAGPMMMGQTIKLVCTGDANPTPTYSFYKDGNLVPGKIGMTTNTISFFVDPDVFNDEGQDYVCKTDNTVGTAESAGLTIVVIGKPEVDASNESYYPVVGTDISYTCVQSSENANKPDILGTLTNIKFSQYYNFTYTTVLSDGSTDRTTGPYPRVAEDNGSDVKCVETYSNGLVIESSTEEQRVGCGDTHRFVPISDAYGSYGCYCHGYRQCDPDKYCVSSTCQTEPGLPLCAVSGTDTTNANCDCSGNSCTDIQYCYDGVCNDNVKCAVSDTDATNANCDCSGNSCTDIQYCYDGVCNDSVKTTTTTTATPAATTAYAWVTTQTGTCATTAGSGACQRTDTVECQETTTTSGTAATTPVVDSFCDDDTNNAGTKPSTVVTCEAADCTTNTETTLPAGDVDSDGNAEDSSLSLMCVLALFSSFLAL